MTKSVAYLGPPGTFTEQAVHMYKPKAETQPFPSIQGVALAVASGIVKEGVVPIENSLAGSVNDTLDILIRQPGIYICQELVLPIEHCLLGLKGTNSSDIKVIYSHPQALGQCREFLERCFPQAQLEASLSTVEAVHDMKQSRHPSASIAPYAAAELNGVIILAQGIQDNMSNRTRFVVLSDEDAQPTGLDKTSLCFSFTRDEPGLLYRVLGEFSKRDVNLAKVESRPSKQFLGDYIFLIDIHGHRVDPIVKEAIRALKGLSSMLKIFGSYPRWADPNSD